MLGTAAIVQISKLSLSGARQSWCSKVALGSGEGKGRKQGVQDLIKMLRDSRRKNLLIFDRASKGICRKSCSVLHD